MGKRKRIYRKIVGGNLGPWAATDTTPPRREGHLMRWVRRGGGTGVPATRFKFSGCCCTKVQAAWQRKGQNLASASVGDNGGAKITFTPSRSFFSPLQEGTCD